MFSKTIRNFSMGTLALLFASSIFAEDTSDAMVQANNPLANSKSFNIHNYYIGEFTGLDQDANQFILRYAQPFSVGSTNWLMRASLPTNTYPTSSDGNHITGVGDFNIFAAYLFDMEDPGINFGVGPMVTAPTSSEDELGSDNWSWGLANVYFNATSKKIQTGYLLTWQGSEGASDDPEDTSIASFQPFFMYQMGGGWYARSTGTWLYDFNAESYSIPVGLGIGKVIPVGDRVYNAFIEPQYSVADEGGAFPQWQIFAGFNTQF